nr:hypothetical protein [uncultured Sphaerochaeta sp.]
MKKGLTELVCILDRSGSMHGLERDTIGGFNAMLAKQQALNSPCNITTVLFDNEYVLLHDRIPIEAVSAMTKKEYAVGGSTALYDAIGRTISKIVQVQRTTAPEYQAEQVIFLIITDGMENASREYTREKVREMIKKEREIYGWEFIYLGANIDAETAAEDVGIPPDRAQDFIADTEGIQLNFEVMSEAVSHYRCASAIPEDWNKRIKKDYKERERR